MAELIKNIDKLKKEFPVIIREEALRLPLIFQKYLKKHLEMTSAGSTFLFSINKGNMLRYNKGRLFRSFNPQASEPYFKAEKKKDSLTEIKQMGTQTLVTIGSNLPYAKIHEKGGFIPFNKPPFGKGNKNNRGFFFATFGKFLTGTSNNTGKGGITIKPRPYFEAAWRDMENEKPKWEKDIIDRLIGVLNG